MHNEEMKEKGNPWWKFAGYVDQFNVSCRAKIRVSWWKTLDESMFAYCLQKTKTGGLPHLSFVLYKPEPLGSETKDVGCTELKVKMVMELQEGKILMRAKKYSKEI